jgi:hypothetical protein
MQPYNLKFPLKTFTHLRQSHPQLVWGAKRTALLDAKPFSLEPGMMRVPTTFGEDTLIKLYLALQ